MTETKAKFPTLEDSMKAQVVQNLEVMDAIIKEENLSKISSQIYKAIQQKHIMFYSADEDIQALFESSGLSGTVHESEPNEDYLSVINIIITLLSNLVKHFLPDKPANFTL